ncbi:MAG: hypothetical protein EPGJADBJ_04916 [Saprospiraceae bacterium]|nr:hypothetical protein [Saprospiraceae bacterium]
MKEFLEIQPDPEGWEALTASIGVKKEMFYIRTGVCKFEIGFTPLEVIAGGVIRAHSHALYYALPRYCLTDGTRVPVSRNSDGSAPVCQALVIRRYWEPARMSDRFIQIPIDRDHCNVLDCKMELTEEEYGYLRMGNIPQSMEDRTAVYMEHDVLYFIRSWLGLCLFEAHLYKAGPGSYRFSAVYSYKGEHTNARLDRYEFERYVRSQIDRVRWIMTEAPPAAQAG